MGSVRTVTGDVPSTGLGLVNSHAHLVVSFEAFDDDRYVDYLFTPEDTEPELRDFAAHGGGCLVELTPIGCGRDPEALRRLSEATGVLVVMGTGIYHEPFHQPEIADWDRETIADHFIREITVGIGDTGVRAGIIGEIGTYQGPITPREREVFLAAGHAAQHTGVAVSTHTYLGRNALEQIELLTSNGLDPSRVVIGHLDDISPVDMGLCREILAAGAIMQFDGIGCSYFSETLGAQMPTDEERTVHLVTLVEEGWGSRILVGSDICRRIHLRAQGGPGLRHLPGVYPETAGVTPDLIAAWLVDNPARLLSMVQA